MALGGETTMGQAVSKAADTLVAAAEGPAPERRPAARNSRLAVFGVALVLALLGLAALAREVHLAILAAPVVTALLWLIKPARPWIARLATPLFALLALVGFNVAWHGVGLERLGVGVGLAVAIVVFTGSAFLYLRALTRVRSALAWSAALAVAVVVAVPVVVGAARGEDKVPTGAPIVSKLDVVLVTDARLENGAPPSPAPSPPAETGGWSIRYSVASAGPGGLRWMLVDSEDPAAANAALAGGGQSDSEAAPSLRPDADHVVLLVPDGTAPVVSDPSALPDRTDAAGQLGRWIGLARDAAPPDVPAFALLETQDGDRLARWREGLAHTGGGAASLQRLGIQALTDVGLRLAVRSPAAEEEQALAIRFRPLLLFDSREALDRPLDVDSFLASGRVQLCTEDLDGTHCEPVSSASQLTNNSSHLRLRVKDIGRDDSLDTAIYVHAVAGADDEAHLLYLDYWWYLPLNPSGVGEGVFCGAGLAIAGLTCFDHQSDWEGITVVVDRSGAEPRPIAVHYAQHDSVAAYAWDELAAEWAKPSYAPYKMGIEDAAARPLAFIANGSHASYPTPCSPVCNQVVSADAPEGPHNGGTPWSGNLTSECVATLCVRPVPTRRGGTEPALWNAFAGPWGERRCFLHYFCDLGGAPGGPAIRHDRYDNPAGCDGRYAPGGTRRPTGDECA